MREQKKNRPILEYGPLILFFITNYFAGIMWGTGVLVVATIIALSLSWIWDRTIPMMALFGGIAVAFFGGLTIFSMTLSLSNQANGDQFADSGSAGRRTACRSQPVKGHVV